MTSTRFSAVSWKPATGVLITLALALVILAGPSTVAEAGGFNTARFGAEHGHPATDSPVAVYFNPAGLALGTGTRVYIEGLFVWRIVDYERPVGAIDNVFDPAGGPDTGTPQDVVAANAGKATLQNTIAAPFIGVASDLGMKNVGVGFALYAPFGGQASWERDDSFAGDTNYPGAFDGVQRWAAIEGSLKVVYVTAAGAYTFGTSGFSVGVGLNLNLNSIDTLRARVATGTDDLVGANGLVLEGRSLVVAKSTSFSAGGGVMYQPNDKLTIGASYQSQPSFGTQTMEGTLTTKFGAGPVTETDIDFEQGLPDIMRLGFKFRPSDTLEVRLSADYMRWSLMENQCLLDRSNPDRDCNLDEMGGGANATGVVQNIRRDWHDTFGVKAGVSYWLSDKVELNGGTAFDSSAVPDETIDASLLDQNKIFLTAGGRFSLMNGDLMLSATYTQVFYFTRDVDAADTPIFDAPSRSPDGAGKYSQKIGFFTLSSEYRF